MGADAETHSPTLGKAQGVPRKRRRKDYRSHGGQGHHWDATHSINSLGLTGAHRDSSDNQCLTIVICIYVMVGWLVVLVGLLISGGRLWFFCLLWGSFLSCWICNSLCHVQLIYAWIIFSGGKQRRSGSGREGRKGGGGGTERRKGRGNCGWVIIYEMIIKS